MPTGMGAVTERCRAKAARRGLGILVGERADKGVWSLEYLAYDETGFVCGTRCPHELEAWLESARPACRRCPW